MLHKISVYTIEKEINDEFSVISNDYKRMIAGFAKFDHKVCYNKKIIQAQKKGKEFAKRSYSEIYSDKVKRYSICLDEKGKEMGSVEFSQIFKNEGEINFFIGGAFGFEDNFLKKCDMSMSLSKMTFSHKIAKIVLFEQIYRALSIVNNHPYHK